MLFAGDSLLGLTDSGKLFQWSLQDKHLRERSKLNVEATTGAWDASPDGKSFAVTLGGSVALWSGGKSTPLTFAEPGGPTSLSFSPDSKRLAVGGKNGRVLAYKVPNGERDPDVSYDTGIGAVAVIAWHPAGRPSAGGTGVFLPPERNVTKPPGEAPRTESSPVQPAVVSRSATLDSYKSSIRSMAFLSDGSLITAAPDELSLWDKSGKQVDTVRWGTLKFRNVVVDPKDRFLVWSDEDTNLGVFGLSEGHFVPGDSSPEDVPNSISSIRIAAGGDRLVTVDSRGSVQTWDIDGTKLIRRRTIKGIKNEGRAIFAAFRSGKAEELFTGNVDGSLRQVQEDGRSILLSKFADPIKAIAAGPASAVLAGTVGGWIHVVPTDASESSPAAANNQAAANKKWAHSASVTQLRCSTSGETLVSTASDGTVKVTSIKNTWKDIKDLGATTPRPRDVAVSDPGDEVLMLANDQKLFRARFDMPARSPDLDADLVAVAPHGEYIVALQTAEHKLTILDSLARRSLFWVRKAEDCEPTAFAISPDARRIAVGCESGKLALMDPTGTSLPLPIPLFETGETVTVVSAAGSRFIAGSSKGRVAIWSENGDKLRGPWKADEDKNEARVSALAVSPDGRTLVAGSSTGIAMWQIGSATETPKPGWTKPPPQDRNVTSVVFSPDGKTILCGFDDKTVHQYGFADGKEKPYRRIEVRRDGNTKTAGVRVSTNGTVEILLTSSDDGEIQLWTSAGEPLTEPRRVVSEGERVDATFAPDGLTILTSRIGTAGPWLPGEPRGWLESACERLRYSSAMADTSAEAVGARAACVEYAWTRAPL